MYITNLLCTGINRAHRDTMSLYNFHGIDVGVGVDRKFLCIISYKSFLLLSCYYTPLEYVNPS